MSYPIVSPPLRDVVIVSTTAGEKESTLIHQSLCKLDLRNYHIVERNRRGLSDVYNEFLDRFAGQDCIVVLAHSDLRICDAFIREKLTEAAMVFNIIGIVGSSHFDVAMETPNYAWPIWPPEMLSGAVEHLFVDGSSHWFSYGPTPRRCVAMDGMFLAVDMLKIGTHRFDPRFSFHLYDIDFCLSAHKKNLVLGTTNVCAQHASVGDFRSDAYRRALESFQKKWRECQ